MKFFLKALGFILIALSTTNTFSQLTADDYLRADSADTFGKLVYNAFLTPTWVESTSSFWYEVQTRRGKEYFLVDGVKLTRKPAFDHFKLAERLSKETGKEYKPFDIPLREISFNKTLTEMEFLLDSEKWVLNLKSKRLNKDTDFKPRKQNQRHWAAVDHELKNTESKSPDSLWVAYTKNFNIYIKNRKTKQEYQLSFDGSEGEYYSTYIQWSPNSKYIAVNKIRKPYVRVIHFIESSPEDQLQPKYHDLEYPKPGDALQIRKPSLFNVEQKKKIEVDTQQFEHQYRVSTPEWRNDSRAFTFEFNQRGHQAYQVVEVNASNGQVSILIDEQTSTFFDYSGKRYRHDVNDGQEIIWASERDGWNHLYLFEGNSGTVKNQITKGHWVVRGVDYVNDDERYIVFRGSGRNQNEDPYLVKYYRVNFDGTELIELTPENAQHSATFSSDFTLFVDNYSRIDMPPTTVLRQTTDGKVVMELEKADISDLIDKGWKTPEVFVAKGRDGKTDIWGNIYRPTNFDPRKSYPIIEAIYAGPHAAHVPKTFRPSFGHFSAMAELGFIIVQIDGMGTSRRSKEFHDVCWKNLKDAGFPDRILWMKAAAKKYPYMDAERVGIFGGSAGGQNAMGALLFHPEFYKVAVSSVGCHDNRMDKIWWNEQWMGYPIGPHYDESSNVVNAHKLQGKLLLTVGEMDNNVDPSSTLQVVNALIKANKDFEFLIFPGQGHGSGGKYGERKKRDFFVKHLLHLATPDWNMVD